LHIAQKAYRIFIFLIFAVNKVIFVKQDFLFPQKLLELAFKKQALLL